ncbi:hypothetical protein ACH5RR_007597 [Cinchona calisaya]|uniref:ZP domain-containing protein n=1 Tax=Cinchona calisaya TaxID=153742 RepID=A0ABD3A8Z7_9GENT
MTPLNRQTEPICKNLLKLNAPPPSLCDIHCHHNHQSLLLYSHHHLHSSFSTTTTIVPPPTVQHPPSSSCTSTTTNLFLLLYSHLYNAPDLGCDDVCGIWRINDTDHSFSTQPFQIRYARRDVFLSMMVAFNLPLSKYEGSIHISCYIEV